MPARPDRSDLKDMLRHVRAELPAYRVTIRRLVENAVPSQRGKSPQLDWVGDLNAVRRLTGSTRQNPTHALRRLALDLLHRGYFYRECLVYTYVEHEVSLPGALQQAAALQGGNSRRWALSTLRRIERLGSRVEAAPSSKAAEDLFAQRLAYMEHAAHTLFRMGVQSRAA